MEEGSEQKGLIGCESLDELSAGGGGSTLLKGIIDFEATNLQAFLCLLSPSLRFSRILCLSSSSFSILSAFPEDPPRRKKRRAMRVESPVVN